MKPYGFTLPMVGFSLRSTKFFHVPFLFLLIFLLSISLESFAGEKARIPAKMRNIIHSELTTSGHSPLAGFETIRTNLYLLNTTNNSTILADGVLTEYHNIYHDSVYREDAYKLTNIKENLGLSRYGYTLAIERRPIITNADTLFFKLWKTTRRSYQLEFITTNLDHPGMQAVLEDAYLVTSTLLALNGTTKIDFSINMDAASSDVNRFRIIYKTVISTDPLPVTFTSIKGYQAKNKIVIDWKVDHEINLARYEVERSVNGIDFSSISTVDIVANRPFGSYTQVDENPASGNNFYRIKSVDKDGSRKYSLIIKVSTLIAGTGSISIYPNPIKGNMVNLRFVNQPVGNYQLRLINNTGQLVYSGRLTINSDNVTQSLLMAQKLGGGIYQLEIKAPDNTVQIQKAIVQD